MIDELDLLERAMQQFPPPDGRVEGVYRRQARRSRNRRVGAGLVVLVIVGVVGALLGRALTAPPSRPADRQIRPNPGRKITNSLAGLYGILSGRVTFLAGPSGVGGSFVVGDESVLSVEGGRVVVLGDAWVPERPGSCTGHPTSREELARWIAANPDLEASSPISVAVGGVDAVRLDVAPVAGANTCGEEGVPVTLHHDNGHSWGLARGERMRLYLVDVPGVARPLAIMIMAPADRFERAVAEAARILESFEFHPSTVAPLPATPLVQGAWPGIWPQATRMEAEAAQRGADAGDPVHAWQADLSFSGAVAERFIREQLGWAGLLPEGSGSFFAVGLSRAGWEADWVFLRCGAEGRNPLYPDDEFAGGCAPTIDQTHFERVDVRTEQLIRRGLGGIWVVTAWAKVPPAEQEVPTTPEERTLALRRIEAFMKARIAGKGAEEYMGQGLEDETRRALYTMSDGTRFARFEIAEPGPRWERRDWPNGHDFGSVVVRVFPVNGGGCMVQEVSVDDARRPFDEKGSPFPPREEYFNTYFQSGAEYAEGSIQCTAPVNDLNQFVG